MNESLKNIRHKRSYAGKKVFSLAFAIFLCVVLVFAIFARGSVKGLASRGMEFASRTTTYNVNEEFPEDSYKAGTAEIKEGPLDPDIYHIPALPYPRGINLIFFADGYLSWNEFDQDVQLVLRQMKTVEPWKSYERYNIYQIRPKELDICGVKIQDERKPVLRCGPEGINRYLNQLHMGHFKLVVLSRRTFQSWANVARLADSGIFFSIPPSPQDEKVIGILFLHMLGHAFGLKDEELFVIAKAHSAAHQPDGPNCAPDRLTAERWWGDLAGQDPRVGYFPMCASKKEYVKPTEGSIMNLGDLSKFVSDYGPVSERYLRKILDYCFSEAVTREVDDPEFFAQYPEFRECAPRY